jgi:CRISPR/Cas system CMR subunit Cmr4 (Cas7 group RAMP superfamily)
MDLKQIGKDTTKTLVSYLTYQALRVVIAQLDETEPKRAYWLRQFTHRVSIQNSEAYLQALFQEEQRLAFRLLTVREHIAEELADYLPELLKTGIQEANLQQRTQQLERMTQVDPEARSHSPDHLAEVEGKVLAQPEAETSEQEEERLPPESLW